MNGQPPLFKRQSTAEPLFLLQETTLPKDYCVAFWPKKDSTVLSLTLKETWQIGEGCYLFLSQTPSDQTQFVNNLVAYLTPSFYQQAVFLWIENPIDHYSLWQTSFIPLFKSANSPYSATLSQFVAFEWNNFCVYLIEGSILTLNTEGNGFSITPVSPQNYAAYWTVESEGGIPNNIKGAIQLPFSGSKSGTLSFALETAEKEFDALDVGCRFFVDNTHFPKVGFLQSLRYPIFHLPTSLSLISYLDPLSPLNPTRTYFSFETSASSSKPIETYYRTNTGQTVSFIPSENEQTDFAPKLVFAVRPSSIYPKDNDPYYLVPSGKFSFLIEDKGTLIENPRFMCGISGLETIGYDPKIGANIYFLPGQNAYLSDVVFPKQSNGPLPSVFSNAFPTSTDVATTSWAYIASASVNNNAIYYAQPQQAPFYYKNPQNSQETLFLDHLEVPTKTLPLPDSPTKTLPTAFPIVAFAGIQDTSLAHYKELELQVFSPLRRLQLYNLSKESLSHSFSSNNAAAPATQGVTPQGFLAGFSEDLTQWQSLMLAQSKGKLFQLTNIKPPFQSALQTNQLFLVISSPQKFKTNGATVASATCLNIEQWSFPISPDQWITTPGAQTLLIFKFYNKSIEELVNNTGLWCQGDDFNEGIPAVQKQIHDTIQKALNNPTQPPEFKKFIDIVTDPLWNGILILNSKVPISALPIELKGLIAGIDTSKFYAHHLGITLTPILNGNSPEGLSPGETSLFGLLYYDDSETHQVYTGSPYHFKVQTLKVLFENSQVASFSSQIELLVAFLFGESVTLQGAPLEQGNNFLLNGTYQKGHYLFLQQNDYRYKVQSQVLDEIEILQAQFITVVPPDPTFSPQSQFLFWGNLRFMEIMNGISPSPCDVLSFGSDVITKVDGKLNFSNLVIDFWFDVQDPTQQSFAFNAGSMAFDLTKSVARPNSLYQHFPLKLKGLIQAKESGSPKSLGYTSIQTPDLTQGLMVYPWYALHYELNLGSLGLLASKTEFTLDFIVGWTPNPDQYTIFVGMKIPGLGNSSQSLISLQGILQLAIQSVQLSMTSENAYILAFKNISLKFFDKSFPPSSQTNITLFGDPHATGNDSTLGWYMAYTKDK